MISTITIGFSRPRNRILPIASWLIRLHQKTPYSHVYIRFYSESINRTLIYEAVGSGTRFVSLKKWEEKAEEIKSFTISVRKCNAVSLLQYCVDHAGQEYGFLQNVGIFLANVFGWKKNPFRKGTNCAEEMGAILLLEGYKIKKPLDLLSPRDIFTILQDKSRNQDLQ